MSEEPNLDNTVITSDSQFIAMTNRQGRREGTELRGCSCPLQNNVTTSAFLVILTHCRSSSKAVQYEVVAF